MNMRVKRLFAIYRDADYNMRRAKIAEGTTADFSHPIGFQVEDFDLEDDGPNQSRSAVGLNGTYPALQEEAFRHLEGKLLTLCDATFTNKTQCDAFKKVVSNNLWSYFQDEVRQTIEVYGHSK